MAKKSDDRKPLSELRGVRYLGSNDRVLRVSDLASAGVSSDEDLVWDGTNDHFVPISKVNAATADYLADQDEFELV